MTSQGKILRTAGLFTPLVLLAASLAFSGVKPKELPFQYVGGTESIKSGCKGKLEMGDNDFTFSCAKGMIHVPYAAIQTMQFRPDVSKDIRKMKLAWKVHPPSGHGSKNRYFAVVFGDETAEHVMVLEVEPDSMRPYLAEIDLRTGKRVDVMSHEDYDSYQ
jgi:hypothetical protein